MAKTPYEVALEATAEAMGILPSQPMTDEQVAEFRERFDEAMRQAGPLQVLAPDTLTPDEIRSLLRECVTVVKPGEVLVIRMSREVTREDAERYQTGLTAWLGENAPGVKVAIVCGDELGVVQSFGPFAPILPVPLDEPEPGAPRPEPRRWEYPVSGALPPNVPLAEVARLAGAQRENAEELRDAVLTAHAAGASWSELGRAAAVVRETLFRQVKAGSPVVVVKATHKQAGDG
jgi:hypothetical protein